MTYAILSVSDKTDLLPFAQFLIDQGFTLISTGGTAKHLTDAGLPVTSVSDFTGHPEMLGGRVKCLHPKVFGGLLAPEHQLQQLVEHQMVPIDLAIINFYPFKATIAATDDAQAIIEKIDIGGPSMVRAAAKNYQRVTVVTDPTDYALVMKDWDQGVPLALRQSLAIKAFRVTCEYDYIISRHFEEVTDTLPTSILRHYEKSTALTYGENPHQEAAIYQDTYAPRHGLEQHHGKALSYNNIMDIEGAIDAVTSHEGIACAIIKHTNPCGLALGENTLEAYRLAFAGDPTSAFGGIIAFNQPIDAATIKAIIEQQFVEVIVAPAIEEGAVAALEAKPNVRLITYHNTDKDPWTLTMTCHGALVQTQDHGSHDLNILGDQSIDLTDPLFAWTVVKSVKSNAIVLAKNGQTLGIGAGQMSRIDAVKIAFDKAIQQDFDPQGAVLASDAFFPFPDVIATAKSHGISCIIQPGGSIRDQSVITAAEEAGITMILTGSRHFKH